MARISELHDDPEHTIPRLLRTVTMLIDREEDPDYARLFGPEHGLAFLRAVLVTQGLYPYAKRPYSLLGGEPHWRTPYTALNIVFDEQLRSWFLIDVQAHILSLCERYELPTPVCARPGESREAVLARLKEWCLTHRAQGAVREQPQQTQAESLTDDELEVLYVLEERDTLTTNEIISGALAQKQIIRADTTIKGVVRRLLALGLIERPRERKGVRLTPAGKARLS